MTAKSKVDAMNHAFRLRVEMGNEAAAPRAKSFSNMGNRRDRAYWTLVLAWITR